MPDPLLDAVLASPEDDAPRRAYATALGDDPRAELIRLQLANKTSQLGARERELLIANKGQWLAAITPMVTAAGLARGFFESVVVDAARFLANAPKLFAENPILDVQLTAVKPKAKEVFASKFLANLRALDLSEEGLDDADAAALAASPHVNGLVWLNLAGNKIGRPGLEAIAGSPNLAKLRWLGFERNVAPDPVPKPSMDDGVVAHLEIPELKKELEAKHGKKAWLAAQRSDVAPRPREV